MLLCAAAMMARVKSPQGRGAAPSDRLAAFARPRLTPFRNRFPKDRPDARPSRWTAEHVAAIPGRPHSAIPLITPASLAPALPGIDLWDLWPLQNADGTTALLAPAACGSC
jgi:hypothetical protein